MDAGVYRNLTRDQYESIDALNQSTIKIAYEKSLAHARWELMHPSESTPAQMEGNAFHTLLLEPALFEKRFAPMPVNDQGDRLSRRTKVGEAAWAKFELEHPEAFPIKPARIEEMRIIRERIMMHPTARRLIEDASMREFTAVWKHPIHGFRCKAQIDLLTKWNGWTVICDVKSALDASPGGFSRAAANYGYMVQAHWYTEGLYEIARADRRFMFLAFEKDPPYAVCVHELAADFMIEGRHRCEVVSRKWAKAIDTGKYPAYPNEPQTLGSPQWALTHARMEEDEHEPLDD